LELAAVGSRPGLGGCRSSGDFATDGTDWNPNRAGLKKQQTQKDNSMKRRDRAPFGRWAKSASLITMLAGLWSAPAHGQAVVQPPQVNGSDVTVKWNTGGALQFAPTVTGPWTTVSNGVTTVSTALSTLAQPARFFRVVDNGRPGEPVAILPDGLGAMPAIQSASMQRLSQATGEGNTRLEVRFAAGAVPPVFSNNIPLFLDDRLAFINDRGQFPDARANDGVFSLAIDVNTDELQAANNRLAQMPASRRFTRQFVDRKPVGSNITLTGFPLSNFTAGASIQLITTNLIGKLKLGCPAGSPLAYDWHKTLMITALAVVQDQARTWDPCDPANGKKMGEWTFGFLMSNICNQTVTGIDPGDFARDFMRTWEFNQTVNSDVVPARPDIKTRVVNDWLAKSAANGFPAGRLDLSIAPFRLCAIVGRPDLRSNTGFTYGGGGGSSNPCEPVCRGGEVRFVFCAVDVANACASLQNLIIFEYCAPGNTCGQIKSYWSQWAALDAIAPAFGPAYRTALAGLTAQSTFKNTAPSRPPNKSAINQIRSNEIDLLPWELREWRLSCCGSDAGFLRQATVVNTPDAGLNNTAVIGRTPVTKLNPAPAPFNPYLGGAAPAPIVWNTLPPANTLAMHKFALNTCNGCHTTETGTGFTHVGCRDFGSFLEAPLSGFLTGISGVGDPRGGASGPYAFADMDRRVIDLDELVNCPCNPFQIVAEPLSITLNQTTSLMAH